MPERPRRPLSAFSGDSCGGLSPVPEAESHAQPDHLISTPSRRRRRDDRRLPPPAPRRHARPGPGRSGRAGLHARGRPDGGARAAGPARPRPGPGPRLPPPSRRRRRRPGRWRPRRWRDARRRRRRPRRRYRSRSGSEHRRDPDMSAFLADVARASLPVAIVLLVLAAAARGVVWAELDHAEARRVARRYLEPLATWCLVAVGVHVLALGAAGDADLLSLVLPLGAGAAAVALRSAGETDHVPEAQPGAAPAAPAAPSPGGSLWAEP